MSAHAPVLLERRKRKNAIQLLNEDKESVMKKKTINLRKNLRLREGTIKMVFHLTKKIHGFGIIVDTLFFLPWFFPSFFFFIRH